MPTFQPRCAMCIRHQSTSRRRCGNWSGTTETRCLSLRARLGVPTKVPTVGHKRAGAGVQVIEKVARLRGFEPPTSGSGDQRQYAMLMILLAQSCTLDHGFVRYSALNGPKTDPSFSRSSERECFSNILGQCNRRLTVAK